MQLTDEQIDRFARQIIVPGIGAVGQERLCSTRVRVLGDPTGCRYAQAYAQAVGMQVTEADDDYRVFAGTSATPWPLPTGARPAPITAWYRLTPDGWHAGLWRPTDPIPQGRDTDDALAESEALHAAAAADAINSLVGLVLGWSDDGNDHEVSLA